MKLGKGPNPYKTYRGKQTAAQLLSSGENVSSIEIADDNIKAFEPIARKWGVDFSLYCDESASPPKWTVLFKSKQADAMTLAFKEFTAKTLGKDKDMERPSVVNLLHKMKELVKAPVTDKTRVKEHGSPEL